MNNERILVFCKYYDNGRCCHKLAYERKIDDLLSQDKDIGGLQPCCPRDAQRNKRGILSCVCERKDKL